MPFFGLVEPLCSHDLLRSAPAELTFVQLKTHNLLSMTAPVQGLRLNPPVTIETWPDIDEDARSVVSDTQDIPTDAPDRDPDFIERDELPCLDPVREPFVTDEDMMRLIELEYGDLKDEEWIDICEY